VPVTGVHNNFFVATKIGAMICGSAENGKQAPSAASLPAGRKKVKNYLTWRKKPAYNSRLC
jgi:hypothetical protein